VKLKELVRDFLYGIIILGMILLAVFIITKYPIISMILFFALVAVLIGRKHYRK
jgi:Na+/H+ antiporter NhaC